MYRYAKCIRQKNNRVSNSDALGHQAPPPNTYENPQNAQNAWSDNDSSASKARRSTHAETVAPIYEDIEDV